MKRKKKKDINLERKQDIIFICRYDFLENPKKSLKTKKTIRTRENLSYIPDPKEIYK